MSAAATGRERMVLTAGRAMTIQFELVNILAIDGHALGWRALSPDDPVFGPGQLDRGLGGAGGSASHCRAWRPRPPPATWMRSRSSGVSPAAIGCMRPISSAWGFVPRATSDVVDGRRLGFRHFMTGGAGDPEQLGRIVGRVRSLRGPDLACSASHATVRPRGLTARSAMRFPGPEEPSMFGDMVDPVLLSVGSVRSSALIPEYAVAGNCDRLRERVRLSGLPGHSLALLRGAGRSCLLGSSAALVSSSDTPGEIQHVPESL